MSAAGTDPDGPRSWLTRLLLENPALLEEAAVVAEAGDDHAYVRARKMISQYLRSASGWPRGADYGSMAHELGDADHAALLWKIAGTDVLLAGDRDARSLRYAARPVTDRERILASVTDAGLIDWDPDGPVRGIDGAVYRPGYIIESEANRSGFTGLVVLAEGAGMSELVGTFASYEAQRRWLADRGQTAVGELMEPDIGLVAPPRLVLEERVLAGLLAHPRAWAEISFALPPDSFTADSRYEIYAAMITLARDGQRWYAGDVEAELARRMSVRDGEAQRALGGDGGPWARTYLRRLRQVEADPETAYQASRKISLEDSCARMRPGQLAAIRTRMRQVSNRRPPEAAAWHDQRRSADLLPDQGPHSSPQRPRGPAPSL